MDKSAPKGGWVTFYNVKMWCTTSSDIFYIYFPPDYAFPDCAIAGRRNCGIWFSDY